MFYIKITLAVLFFNLQILSLFTEYMKCPSFYIFQHQDPFFASESRLLFCFVFPGTLTEMKVKYVKCMYHDLHYVLVLLCSLFHKWMGKNVHSYYFSTFLYKLNLRKKWFKLNGNKIRHKLYLTSEECCNISGAALEEKKQKTNKKKSLLQWALADTLRRNLVILVFGKRRVYEQRISTRYKSEKWNGAAENCFLSLSNCSLKLLFF